MAVEAFSLLTIPDPSDIVMAASKQGLREAKSEEKKPNHSDLP
jgi:hypothetical protein